MSMGKAINGLSPTAAALGLTERILPAKLGRRVAEQVESSDFRGATMLVRRALGAGRALQKSWSPEPNGNRNEEQRYWLRQLLSLVDDLRVQQRHASPPPRTA